MSKYYDEILKLAEKEEEKVRKLLIQNYVNVLADIKRKLKVYIMDNENLTFAKQLELKRLDNLITQINIVLNKLYDNNYKIIKDYDRETMEREYFGVFYEVENLANINLSFSMLNERYIQEAIEFPVDGLKLSERLYDKYLMDMKYRVKGAVTQGLINSSGYADIAKTISDVGFTNFEHAMTIAITEAGRMKSLARQKGQQEALNKGVKLEKKWVSVLDKKTRHSHQKLDGQIVPIDGEFESNGHKAPQPRLFGVASEDIRCRCDTITIVEGISPELRKDNENKQHIKYKNYEDWHKEKNGEINNKVYEAKNRNGDKIDFNLDKMKEESEKVIKDTITELSSKYNTRLIGVTNEAARKGIKGSVGLDFKMNLSTTKKDTIVHEFAHSLSMTKADKLGLTDDKDFWKEIKKIRTQYNKAISKDISKKISNYSLESIDEFMAEAFAQAYLKSSNELGWEYGSDYEYADKVMDIIDKYFKKK